MISRSWADSAERGRRLGTRPRAQTARSGPSALNPSGHPSERGARGKGASQFFHSFVLNYHIMSAPSTWRRKVLLTAAAAGAGYYGESSRGFHPSPHGPPGPDPGVPRAPSPSCAPPPPQHTWTDPNYQPRIVTQRTRGCLAPSARSRPPAPRGRSPAPRARGARCRGSKRSSAGAGPARQSTTRAHLPRSALRIT